MSELLQAAKAVIVQWDRNGYPVELVMWEPVKQLRAAVERAEKQETVGFDAWWESAGCGGYWNAHAAWMAAQQFERERIKEMAKEMIRTGDPCPWIDPYRLLEKIDASEDS